MKYGKNNVWMQDLENRFRLYNICLDDRLWTVDQSKELLDGGRSRTQDGWNEWLESEENKEKWQLASGPMYHAVLAALHYSQNHEDKKQRKLIKQCREMHRVDFKKNWIMNSTRIIYTPEGLDKIVHDYGSPEQKEIELTFVGPDKYIDKKSGLEKEIHALLGTADLDEVKQVYHGLTGNKPYLWRLNNKPNQETPRAAGFDFNNYLFLVSGYYIDYGGRSRGVWVSPQGALKFDDSSLRGALSLVGDAGNLSLADAGKLSLK